MSSRPRTTPRRRLDRHGRAAGRRCPVVVTALAIDLGRAVLVDGSGGGVDTPATPSPEHDVPRARRGHLARVPGDRTGDAERVGRWCVVVLEAVRAD